MLLAIASLLTGKEGLTEKYQSTDSESDPKDNPSVEEKGAESLQTSYRPRP